MSLVGNTVEHGKFGKGIISDFSGSTITVTFPEGEKKFIYPDAFSNFLVLKDEEKQEAVMDVYNEAVFKRKEKLHKKRQQEERVDRLLSIKSTPQSQAVFDIESEKLSEIMSGETMFAGCCLSGKTKGNPKIPAKLKPNSACILTSVPEGKPEKDRKILGIFMVGENFYGARCRDGFISMHPEHRIVVPEDVNLSYWKYAANDKTPRWGRTSFKYFSNSVTGDIMDDLLKLYEGKPDEEKMQKMRDYYFKINHLK